VRCEAKERAAAGTAQRRSENHLKKLKTFIKAVYLKRLYKYFIQARFVILSFS